MKKTWQARATCVFCLVSIASLQGLHFAYFVDQIDLLAMRGYLLLLALVPVSFYFFSRTQLFHEQKLSWSDACHFLVLVPALDNLPRWLPVHSLYLHKDSEAQNEHPALSF